MEEELKEIEHSKKKRNLGFERFIDTHARLIDNLEELIKDKEKFNYYFANMKFYSVTQSSEKYKADWIEKECKSIPNPNMLDFAWK